MLVLFQMTIFVMEFLTYFPIKNIQFFSSFKNILVSYNAQVQYKYFVLLVGI